jgi:hypothetical protein
MGSLRNSTENSTLNSPRTWIWPTCWWSYMLAIDNPESTHWDISTSVFESPASIRMQVLKFWQDQYLCLILIPVFQKSLNFRVSFYLFLSLYSYQRILSSSSNIRQPQLVPWREKGTPYSCTRFVVGSGWQCSFHFIQQFEEWSPDVILLSQFHFFGNLMKHFLFQLLLFSHCHNSDPLLTQWGAYWRRGGEFDWCFSSPELSKDIFKEHPNPKCGALLLYHKLHWASFKL